MSNSGSGFSPDSRSAPRPVPAHVAIIMDGNGRWATSRGLPRISGHEAGTENIRRITSAAGDLGIKYLTLWAFSTENWRRPRDEVDGILRILSDAIDVETEALHERGAQLRHIGSLEGLSPELQNSIRNAVHLTRDNDTIVLTLAFNYGGRTEIARAVQRIVADGVPAEQITEALISSYLYTSDMPDPDLIVRTSGEFRTSNFLIWQAAFSEYHITPVLWPDFKPEHLQQAVEDYQHRERRFGGIGHRATSDEPSP
ncbi:MAG: polyprenyl diphosphate synthase [Thermomicrobiaceae bacterium]